MQLRSWKRLTWWQRTRVLAATFGLLSFVMTLALCVTMANIEVQRSTLNWVTFSLFPLIAVCVIAAFAQIQSSLNDTRGALSNFSDPDGTNGIEVDDGSR